MTAALLQVEVSQAVEQHHDHVARARQPQPDAVLFCSPAAHDMPGSHGCEGCREDCAQLATAVVGQAQTERREIDARRHPRGPMSRCSVAAKSSSALTDSSPSAIALTRTSVSSPVMPPV